MNILQYCNSVKASVHRIANIWTAFSQCNSIRISIDLPTMTGGVMKFQQLVFIATGKSGLVLHGKHVPVLCQSFLSDIEEWKDSFMEKLRRTGNKGSAVKSALTSMWCCFYLLPIHCCANWKCSYLLLHFCNKRQMKRHTICHVFYTIHCCTGMFNIQLCHISANLFIIHLGTP